MQARTRTGGPSTSFSSRTWAPCSRRRSWTMPRSRGATPVDRRGAREGQPAHARGARAPALRRPAVRREHRRSDAARGRRGRRSSRTASRATSRLKTLEGTVKSLLDALRSELEASARGRLGGALIRPAARKLRERLDPGDIRRRLSPRAERARRDRTRLELATSRSQNAIRHSPLAGSRASQVVERLCEERMVPWRVSIGALHDPDGREVRFQAWRLRVRRSSSRSKAR